MQNRLEELTHYRTNGSNLDLADLSDNTVIARFDYHLRDDGWREGVTETFEGGNVNDIDYTYDDMDRLIGEVM